MLTRFDHAVIAVRDLDLSIAAFRRLGFDTRRGGVHPGMGTANAVIQFGLDYIELITVVDREAGRAAGPVIQVLLDFLQQAEGFVGYGITSDDLQADAARIRRSGLAVHAMPLSRQHADGTAVRWTLGLLDGKPWLQPWPFLIQCETPDEVRLRSEPPGDHGNGACGCVGAVVGTGGELNAGRVLGEAMGLAPTVDGFRAGSFALLASTEPGPPGLRELRIAVQDLRQARAALPPSAIARAADDQIAIDPARTAGARIVLARGGTRATATRALRSSPRGMLEGSPESVVGRPPEPGGESEVGQPADYVGPM